VGGGGTKKAGIQIVAPVCGRNQLNSEGASRKVKITSSRGGKR